MEAEKLADAEWNQVGSIISLADDATFGQFGDWSSAPAEPYAYDLAFGVTNSFFSLHRFEYAFSRLRLGISAMQVVSRAGNAVYLGDFFPVFSWHNSEVGYHNMSMVVEATLVPFSGSRLFLQAGADDINAGELLGIADSEIPTIPFLLAGFGWDGSLASRPFSLAAEVGSTHYLWGNFHEYDINRTGGNYLSRAIYRYKRDADYVLLPLTSPYGPGVIWFHSRARLDLFPFLDLDLQVRMRWRNPLADMVTTEYTADEAIASAALVDDHRFSLKGEWSPLGRSWKEKAGSHFYPRLFLEPAFLFRSGNVGFELSAGGTLEMVNAHRE